MLWQRVVDPSGADPADLQQRAALALSRGLVYVSYGGLYGDCGAYHGWVVAAPAAGPTGALVAYQVPTAREGGIWGASGPAIDPAGNVYVTTGNGSSSSFDYGDSVLRLTSSLQLSQYFAPANSGSLNTSDADLGSTGALLLPGGRVVAIGKSGVAYLLSASRLGGIGHPLASLAVCNEAFGGMAYTGEVIYVPCTSGLVALQVSGNALSRAWTQSAATLSPIVAGNGVWAMGGGSVYQLDPVSGRVRFTAPVGDAAPFATPATSGGRVFVAAGRQVVAFG